jgi:probable phosphoglycerate mutase
VAVEVIAGLEEMRLPAEWEGLPADRVSAMLRAARERPAEEWWNGVGSGESFHDFHQRVTGAVREILRRHGASPVTERHGQVVWQVQDREAVLWVVAHGGTNSVAVADLLGLSPVPWAWERFVMQHASVTRLRATRLLGGAIFGLREHSDVGHLPRDLRTR